MLLVSSLNACCFFPLLPNESMLLKPLKILAWMGTKLEAHHLYVVLVSECLMRESTPIGRFSGALDSAQKNRVSWHARDILGLLLPGQGEAVRALRHCVHLRKHSSLKPAITLN